VAVQLLAFPSSREIIRMRATAGSQTLPAAKRPSFGHVMWRDLLARWQEQPKCLRIVPPLNLCRASIPSLTVHEDGNLAV
jgi:hypothetical protein